MLGTASSRMLGVSMPACWQPHRPLCYECAAPRHGMGPTGVHPGRPHKEARPGLSNAHLSWDHHHALRKTVISCKGGSGVRE
eukprot:scaffold63979_cov22-Tisochrysis_lutea.AAC.1